MNAMVRQGVGIVLLIAGGLAATVFLRDAASAQDKPLPPKEYERLIYSVKGAELYRAHCAACHGAQGKGDGPVAPTLKAKPADLTMLSKKNGGTFPAQRATKIIVGDDAILIHGTREMPIWGPIFHQIEDDRDFGNVRVQNLIKYLETIQQK